MSASFRFLDTVALADLAFEACGDTVQEVFQGATNALVESLANPNTVGSRWQEAMAREDRDPASLLFDWLSELVYWKDAAGVVYSRSEIRLEQGAGGVWKLEGRVWGDPVNPETQELRADVKGVTKHLYQLVQVGERWTVRVVLDV